MRTTEIGEFIAKYLDLDLEVLTKELKAKKVKTQTNGDDEEEWADDWMGPEGLPVNDGSLVALDQYHGDFKHKKREVDACGCGSKH